MSLTTDKIDRFKDGILGISENIKKAADDQKSNDLFRSTAQYKFKAIEKERNKCANACALQILGTIYVKSLPLDQDYKELHDAELRDDLGRYINDKNPNGAYYYVKDSYQANPRATLLQRVITETDAVANDFAKRMYLDPEISGDDVQFVMDDSIKNKLSEKESSYEMLCNTIKTQVQDTALAEIDAAKKSEQEKQDIEDSLMNNPDIDTEAKLESALSMIQPKVHQPSLFEAILYSKTSAVKESVGEVDYKTELGETIKEYTKIALENAMGIEKYTIQKTKDLIYKYLA